MAMGVTSQAAMSGVAADTEVLAAGHGPAVMVAGEGVKRRAGQSEHSEDVDDMQRVEFLGIHGACKNKKWHPACAVRPKALVLFKSRWELRRRRLLSDLRPSSCHRRFGSRKEAKAKSGY